MKQCLTSWKCKLKPQGNITHYQNGKTLKIDDAKGFGGRETIGTLVPVAGTYTQLSFWNVVG